MQNVDISTKDFRMEYLGHFYHQDIFTKPTCLYAKFAKSMEDIEIKIILNIGTLPFQKSFNLMQVGWRIVN